MELLEYLRIQTDCDYISDLRGCKRVYSIKNALINLEIGQYSLKEWNDAVSYISLANLTFATAEDAANYLKHLSRDPADGIFQAAGTVGNTVGSVKFSRDYSIYGTDEL